MIRTRVIAIATVLTAGLFLAGCTESAAHQARRAAAGISSGLAAVQDANEMMYSARRISAQETIAIAQAVSDASVVNDQFSTSIKVVTATDPNNKAALLSLAQTVLARLDALNVQIAAVRDPDVAQQLHTAFNGMQAAIDLLRVLISQARPGIDQDGAALSASTERKYGSEYRSDDSRAGDKAGGRPASAGAVDRSAARRIRGVAGCSVARSHTRLHQLCQERIVGVTV